MLALIVVSIIILCLIGSLAYLFIINKNKLEKKIQGETRIFNNHIATIRNRLDTDKIRPNRLLFNSPYSIDNDGIAKIKEVNIESGIINSTTGVTINSRGPFTIRAPSTSYTGTLNVDSARVSSNYIGFNLLTGMRHEPSLDKITFQTGTGGFAFSNQTNILISSSNNNISIPGRLINRGGINMTSNANICWGNGDLCMTGTSNNTITMNAIDTSKICIGKSCWTDNDGSIFTSNNMILNSNLNTKTININGGNLCIDNVCLSAEDITKLKQNAKI